MSQLPVISESNNRFCKKPKKKRSYRKTAFTLMAMPIINETNTTKGCQELSSEIIQQSGEEFNKETFLLHRQDKITVMNNITKFLMNCYSSLDPTNYKSVVTVTYMKKAKND